MRLPHLSPSHEGGIWRVALIIRLRADQNRAVNATRLQLAWEYGAGV